MLFGRDIPEHPINALPAVMADARAQFPDETHVLICGDSNANCADDDEAESPAYC